MEAELNALGDEFETDVDTSYLDEALNAPGVPSKEPGYESKVIKIRFFFVFDDIDCVASCISNHLQVTEGGIAVDEFGLPKVPANN